jgi:hypothetical protein
MTKNETQKAVDDLFKKYAPDLSGVEGGEILMSFTCFPFCKPEDYIPQLELYLTNPKAALKAIDDSYKQFEIDRTNIINSES